MNNTAAPVDWTPDKLPPVIILCGGRSRRMGTDKTRLPLPGGTVYSRIEDIFAPHASHLIVVTGHTAEPPVSERSPIVVRDEYPDLGPLEGLRVGLIACQEIGASLAMVTTADAPMVEVSLYRYMVKSLLDAPGMQAVVPFADNTWHPLTAVYRTAIATNVAQRVATSQLRVKDLVDSLAVLKLTEDILKQYDARLQSLRNFNTRDQYEQMVRELKKGNTGGPDVP